MSKRTIIVKECVSCGKEILAVSKKARKCWECTSKNIVAQIH